MTYVFRRGNSEVEFTASSDIAAWAHVVEVGLTNNRNYPVPGERLLRVEEIAVERPDKSRIDQYVRLMAAANMAAANSMRTR